MLKDSSAAFGKFSKPRSHGIMEPGGVFTITTVSRWVAKEIANRIMSVTKPEHV